MRSGVRSVRVINNPAKAVPRLELGSVLPAPIHDAVGTLLRYLRGS